MAFNPRSGRGDSSMAEINITPFVDVVLVLLIIFMLTAHVMEYGIEVDVPKTKEVASTTREMPVVNVTPKGGLYVNADPVNINNLVKRLEPLLGSSRGAYLRVDKDVPWETAVQVMAELGRAKVQVNVVSQPLEQAPVRK
ncbi:MAG: biopolymer transporter ExbD [Acidobacteria bacterium]|nr:biopolymer transporter ExbD [Acidobacteriota bacterium]